jgi:hypothetical protein
MPKPDLPHDPELTTDAPDPGPGLTDDTQADLIDPDDERDVATGIAPDTRPPDHDGPEDVQGSVPSGDGDGNETVSIPVGGDNPPIDVPKAAYDDPGPTPITPASSQQQYDARVKFENQVNQQLDAWIAQNRGELLSILLAGGEIQFNDASANDKDDATAISPETPAPKS